MKLFKKSRYTLYIIIFCIFTTLFSGCQGSHSIYSNFREISQLQVIRTMGVDSEEKGKVSVTVASSVGANDEPPSLISRSGSSISQALESIQDYSSKEYIFYAHTNNVLIGEDFAREGIDGLLDYLLRAPDLRAGIDMYLVADNSAKELISKSASPNYDISDGLNSVKNDVEIHTQSHVFTCAEIYQQLCQYGSALICALELIESEDSVFSESPEIIAKPLGYGVLKDCELIGYLTGNDARAVGLFMGNLSGGFLQLDLPRDSWVTVEFINSDHLMKPHWSYDGSLESLEFNFDIRCGIVSSKGEMDFMDEGFVDELSQAISEEVSSWICNIIDFSIQSESDFLGLGRDIRLKQPAKFDAMPLTWSETLSSLDYNVDVRAAVELSFELENPTLKEESTNASRR